MQAPERLNLKGVRDHRAEDGYGGSDGEDFGSHQRTPAGDHASRDHHERADRHGQCQAVSPGERLTKSRRAEDIPGPASGEEQ